MPSPTVEKVSLTIDSDVLGAVRTRVPQGGMSAYTTAALKRQLERDGIADLVAELVQINGPLDNQLVEKHLADWR